MKLNASNNVLSDIKADYKAVFIIENNIEEISNKDDIKVLEELNFKSTSKPMLVSHSKTIYANVKLSNVYGSDHLDPEAKYNDDIREASANIVKLVKNTKITSLKVNSFNNKLNTTAMLEGFLLGNYNFDKFKTDKITDNIKDIYISKNSHSDTTVDFDLDKLIESVTITSNNVNMVRDLVNTPPNIANPKEMVSISEIIAKDLGIKIDVLDEHKMQKEEMNATLAVGRASDNRPYTVHLKYKPKNPKLKIALVGKGLTYDCGGLDIKIGGNMKHMKADKGGACAVLGIIKSIAELKLDVEVHALCGFVENSISGNAYRSDDIITTKSKKTIEIRNTDAEGRVVLCDVLTYIQEKEKNFDYIFDYATLTGASVVAMGANTMAIMGHNRELTNEVHYAGEEIYELAGVLPFHKKLSMKGSVSDLVNASDSRLGGAITAGIYLDEFIENENKKKWVHFDIAGPAFVSEGYGHIPAGGTGAGVRITLNWLKHRLNK